MESKKIERVMRDNHQLRGDNAKLKLEKDELESDLIKEKQFKLSYLTFSIVFIILGLVMLYW